MTARDNFTARTKIQIAKRAGWTCSYPGCGRATVGANSSGDGEINLGVAAHICAAAPGGPRYDPEMDAVARSGVDNGLWLCQQHSVLIDAKEPAFTVERLRQWRDEAWATSWRRLVDLPDGDPSSGTSAQPSGLAKRFRDAAAVDLDAFRRSPKWPATTIALTLEVEGLDRLVTTTTLAGALVELDDLVLVAEPGLGKTTTIFQIADAALRDHLAIPLIVPLGDWGVAPGVSLLNAVLSRSAYAGLTETDLKTLAAKPGAVLLLDGWNELDEAARRIARVELATLQREMPHLGLLISTRRQMLDVPLKAAKVRLRSLDEGQQRDIARSLLGEAGVVRLDRAWRTPGVRELVSIPLYLTSLLALPEGAPFPTTKEAVLRLFVDAHDLDHAQAEALAEIPAGHARYLEGLADKATRTARSSLADAEARAAVSATSAQLLEEGQIGQAPLPDKVLATLVDRHVLMRAGDKLRYSFQHQQFQEWYASQSAERLILNAGSDPSVRERLRTDILDRPAWTEAVLFACERLSRAGEDARGACAEAILAALLIDPMLAADMVRRSAEPVWQRVAEPLQSRLRNWHTEGQVDRAVRAMILTGRPEFFDQLWPLITHENQQTRLGALRAGGAFQIAQLGPDPRPRIAALETPVRLDVLAEIASKGGVDGLDLAAAVAAGDPDPEVKRAVIVALAFRRADRHLAIVLAGSDDTLLEQVVRRDLIDEVSDPTQRRRIESARARLAAAVDDAEGLRTLMRRDAPGAGAQVTALIGRMEPLTELARTLIGMAQERYPADLAAGLIDRIRQGRSLPYGTPFVLAECGVVVDDADLADIALGSAEDQGTRAEAAAAVLGPTGTGRLLADAWEIAQRIRRQDGLYDRSLSEQSQRLRSRLQRTPGASLATAAAARWDAAGDQELAFLAGTLASHPQTENERGKPYPPQTQVVIRGLAVSGGDRLLASQTSTRSQLASIADLIRSVPDPGLLALTLRLLDDELRRYRAARVQAEALRWQPSEALNEARASWVWSYRQALQKLPGAAVAEAMKDYLLDPDFGAEAAWVIVWAWIRQYEPERPNRIFGGFEPARVVQAQIERAGRAVTGEASAAPILRAIDELLQEPVTDRALALAGRLAAAAARLPQTARPAVPEDLAGRMDRRARLAVLQGLTLAGDRVPTEQLRQGVEALVAAAGGHGGGLHDSQELKEWIELIPFSDQPKGMFGILQSLPTTVSDPGRHPSLIQGFAATTGSESEALLFDLAEAWPGLYDDHEWLLAVRERNTPTSRRRLVDLAASGVLTSREVDHWRLAEILGEILREDTDLRNHVYDLLWSRPVPTGFDLLARAVAELSETHALLLLVHLSIETGRPLFDDMMIEKVVTRHVADAHWANAYDIVPVAVGDLRRDLLGLTGSGDVGDFAARCLEEIDRLRDDYGLPADEPRHPDVRSGKPWPLIQSSSIDAHLHDLTASALQRLHYPLRPRPQ